MFRKKHHRKSSFLPFVIFRTLLSLTIFLILVLGVYSAFTHFSGVDILKGSPQAIVANFLSEQNLSSLVGQILNQKATTGSIDGISEEEVSAPETGKEAPPKGKLSFKFALITDSHSDNNYLKKALSEIKKEADVKFVIGLGDYTEAGTEAELSQAKKELDASGVRYFLTAGDHDLWDSRDKQNLALTNFVKVFGPPYQSFSYDNVRFIILDNSDNYLGFGPDQLDWLSGELDRINVEKPKLILTFLHEPLYHPSSIRVMGKVEPKLKDEAKSMIKTLKENRVGGIFAGDIHYFTSYEDPETNLKMYTLGAITQLRNVQNPRYGVVSVYEDGTYSVEDVEIR